MFNKLNYLNLYKKLLFIKKTLFFFFKNTFNVINFKLSFFLIKSVLKNIFTKNNFYSFIFFCKLNIKAFFNFNNLKTLINFLLNILIKIFTKNNLILFLNYLLNFLKFIYNFDLILKSTLLIITIIFKDFFKFLFLKTFNLHNLKFIINFFKNLFYFIFNWRKIYKGSKNFIKWAIIDIFNIIFTVDNFVWLIKFIFIFFKKTFYFIFNSNLVKFLRCFFNFRVVRHITYFTDLWKGVLLLWFFFLLISTKFFNLFIVKNVFKNEELRIFIIENCKYPVTILYYPLYKYGMYVLLYIVLKLFKIVALFFYFLPLDFEIINELKFFIFKFIYLKYLSVDLFTSRKIAFLILNLFFYTYCFYKFKQTIFSKGWVVFKK